ncbi:bifunctional phosphopantothenoylcysteine decarboxylase/phosphopantothenate--cysteine ligase CoaBC [Komagataeibacter intermedius]|uniref:Coenzyme A biosynthesis bifunctional protein CoaBC n=2 Tax=Komagataeibacter intermedius TaxID=66229 RepID=A0A0N1N4F9_9PROT|nr:bifunctional phosphopantothenoylcysteine decarboxylase/phosphopantothenate--cysteine ligase CoaBC [Komagataeibacter intermedius]KPH86282.1 phosphopantothenate synthase [Komagataeibacter intermedius AF2]MCF3637243.1 bifunctional phosphopantothenoylcysteine decarboxylase/phosphopantothenate--cysteine ligase CoaBC [Komagataeibacter intermedius]GAN87778.1 phosphopantothenoylcysteine synthase [Komagataeibacter intermedius TF2]GBQ68919.1 phosphopantothenoylcysteine synthase [Komagataeibacter inter
MEAGATRSVLLVVGGGIAAYKALELIRRLRERGLRVRTVLTDAGARFVTPMSIQALSGERIFSDLFSLTDESEMGHIALSRSSDLIVVCPATADLLARMAAGLANDLATTVLLATDTPVLVAPAMNVRMWTHAATQANVATLRARGVTFVGPDSGLMACNESGPGRLAEPDGILSAILRLLHPDRPLAGRSALVTAGPTHEPIDPVRYIANRSSGTQGYAIAAALAAAGADVTLVSGPTTLPDPAGMRTVRVETAHDMLEACRAALPCDIAVCTAAVADWHVAPAPQKIKKTAGAPPPVLQLAPNPDILATLSQPSPTRPGLVIGFAAETEHVVPHATAKRLRKGCDWIVANDVSPGTGIMGGTENEVCLIDATGCEHWPRLDKTQVARKLVARIATFLQTPHPNPE